MEARFCGNAEQDGGGAETYRYSSGGGFAIAI
jgi:hypothetical protein